MTYQPHQSEDATLRPVSHDREIRLLKQVVDRGIEMADEYGRLDISYNRDMVVTYIVGCHDFAAPLQLRELLDAPNHEFAHDFFGILHHFDLSERRLRDCFCPRYAVREELEFEGGVG